MNKVRLYRWAFRLLPYVPRRFAQYIALAASLGVWALAGSMRQRVRANLAHIPALAKDPRRLDAAVRRSFAWLLLSYVDLFIPPRVVDAAFRAHFHIAGRDDYLRARAAAGGTGCIILSVHSAGFEWGRYYLPYLLGGAPVAPMETLTPPELYTLVETERNRSGIQFLPITESTTLRAMIAALRRGDNVLLAADRDILRSGVPMPLFGAPTRLPTGPIALARLTGAPLLLMTSWRRNLDEYQGNVTPLAITVDAQTRGEAAVRQALEPVVREMEAQIASHADQWLAAFAGDVWDVAAPALAGEPANEVHSG